MIIRHKHKGQFSIVPNGIFHDPDLSLRAKGLLVYLLSLPPDWEVRHDQLQRKLHIGRKLLQGAFKELIVAGYAVRDELQGRDEHNRFTTLNYVVSDISNRTMAEVPAAVRSEPRRKKNSGSNKERIKTDPTNSFTKSWSDAKGREQQASQRKYTEIGSRAVAAGQIDWRLADVGPCNSTRPVFTTPLVTARRPIENRTSACLSEYVMKCASEASSALISNGAPVTCWPHRANPMRATRSPGLRGLGGGVCHLVSLLTSWLATAVIAFRPLV